MEVDFEEIQPLMHISESSSDEDVPAPKQRRGCGKERTHLRSFDNKETAI